MGRLLHSKDTNRAVKTNPFGLLSLLLLVACLRDPVDWGDVSYRPSRLGDPDARSAIMSANLPSIPGTAGQCLRSIRTAVSGNDLFRVWWSSKADSAVVLSMQHSADNGATWQDPTVLESRDNGRRGCDRPEPGIFYDAKSGYIFLVYFIEAADGAGVFFAHSMDKGRMFHSPVPVVYGNAPSHASVAANGDSVVAVFEDPNSTTSRIGIVLSGTTGHIFEQRGQVTPDDVQAIKPWVKLDHSKITVWWKSGGTGESVADRVGYREGVWR
ncbi:MAG TPA: sialidase family protein [Gemmatimonadaceae bacterium]|nr:sialidase family protein [Gemmatimonadaceae bacterium]